MRILVFGQTGQVARELARRCPTGVSATFLGRSEADLSIPGQCAQAILDHAPDAVINAAAWTAVDKAETAEAEATLINATSPGEMARACAQRNIPFSHVSTDYVFDGTGTSPFTPSHPTAPLGAYGRSKLAGELAIHSSGARYLILRTSWVFSAHGSNFVKTMLRLGAERAAVSVVADQVGGPTPAAAIADALYAGIGGGGVFHFSGAPDVSWADFARAIMEEAGLPCRIEDIPTTAYPTPARRPMNSRLDCSDFERAFGIPRPDWRAGLTEVLQELKGTP